MQRNPSKPWLRILSPILIVNILLGAGLAGRANAAVDNTRHRDGRGTLKLVFPPPGAGVAAKGRQGAEDFLRAHHGDFKLPADLANLELVSARESLLGTHYRYRQLLNGVPVEGAQVVVSIRRDTGEVFQVYNNSYPVDLAPAAPAGVIGEAAALDAAWSHLRVHGRLLGAPQARLVYLPAKGGFRLAYKTYTPVEAPFGHWEHRIDALTGEVIAVRDTAVNESKKARQLPDFAAYTGTIWSRTEATRQWESAAAVSSRGGGINKISTDGTALVFDGDPRTYLANPSLVDSSPASDFAAAYVTRPLRDISENGGVYSLDGPWVTIIDFDLPYDPPSTTTNGQWTALRGDNAFNDAMTYFHIDQNQRYLQALGYTGATGIQYGPIGADSDGVDGDDNSYYVPASNQLSFGHGGVDDNEDADVILHEYGHAITYSILPTWGGGDTEAIGEGFGDYWGASYSSTTTNGRTFHPEWAFSWDGHSADTWMGRFLNMTNLTYDSNYTYSAHETIQGIPNYSDQLWSTPLFQSFLALQDLGCPRTNIDKIILESFFGLGTDPTMRDVASATVNAASLLFPAGPYAEVFRAKFSSQLILPPLPLPAPVLLYPVGGEVLSAGAVVQVQWDRQGAPAAAAARLEFSAGARTNFLDSMENSVNGWSVAHGSGYDDWTQVTTSSHSPTHSWFAPDPSALTDQYLQSPLVSVATGDVLSFWHSYNLERGYDGGVVEASTDGATWIDLGGSSTQNGYNDVVSTYFGNPIGGRSAFTGNSGGYVETKIPLATYAGQSVYIRFRAASDSSFSGVGWYVDDVMIGSQWLPLGTTPTNAASFEWPLPLTPGTNYQVRVQQFGDGYSDSAWAESALFTLSARPPRPIQSLVISNGVVRLSWTAVAGGRYRVEYKTNLDDPAWLPLLPDVVAGGPTASIPDQPLVERRFYRILAP